MWLCACERAVIRLSDVFTQLGSEPNDICVHENVYWANFLTLFTSTCTRQTHGSLHLYKHLTCACKHATVWCVHVHVNVQWSNCLICLRNWAVSPMTDMCMKMCSEPIVWLSAHVHEHVRHTGHNTFTCTWYVHVNVQLSDCLMCSITGQWAQWPMCAWKCAVSQLSNSLHIYMHTSDTRVTGRLHAPDVCM